ncbi:MAG TPA: hypothetical protein PLC81_03195 [Bacteroidales bacterium]|nr:hypothetical protein [Bacteroidales bacterium]HQH40941.1 hypothetical protein [Bacteroidales bacterium]HQK36616.1 hypothetical protein [Bacteroidales bacterium]
MKRKNWYFRILVAGFLIQTLAIQIVAAQEKQYTKKFHEEYQAGAGDVLRIENIYGNVTIKNWNQNKVVIDVVATLVGENQEKADRILGYVNVDFSYKDNEIRAVTVLDSKFNSNQVFGNEGRKKFSIDYIINMPEAMQLTLLNKYGDVAINELSGLVDVNVKYGNLRANRLKRTDNKPLSQITLGYGNATIDECQWLKIDMKYSKMSIEKAKALVVISKYSKLMLTEGSSLVSDAKYDTYEIGTLVNFAGTGAYTNYRFDKIANKIDLNLRYSDCRVDFVPASFESIEIDNSYGSIRLGIEEGASYQLDGNARFSKILYPENMAKVSRIVENTQMQVSGRIGKDEKTSSRVRVTTEFGNVSLQR